MAVESTTPQTSVHSVTPPQAQHVESNFAAEPRVLEDSEEDIAPSHAVSIAPRWNESGIMAWRVTATFWCTLVMGANDAAYGAIIPYVRLPAGDPHAY